MDVFKAINLRVFLAEYAGGRLPARKVKSGRLSRADEKLIIDGIQRLAADLTAVVRSRVVLEPPSLFDGPVMAEPPVAPVPVVQKEEQKKWEDFNPPIPTIPNVEPYRFAESKPKRTGFVRQSIVSW